MCSLTKRAMELEIEEQLAREEAEAAAAAAAAQARRALQPPPKKPRADPESVLAQAGVRTPAKQSESVRNPPGGLVLPPGPSLGPPKAPKAPKATGLDALLLALAALAGARARADEAAAGVLTATCHGARAGAAKRLAAAASRVARLASDVSDLSAEQFAQQFAALV